MRRLIAALAFLSFANIAFVQADCPLAGRFAHEHQVAASQPGHAAHAAHSAHAIATPMGQEGVQSLPEGSAPDSSACPMMGPCLLTIDVSGIVGSSALPRHADGVLPSSDQLPASLALVPEPPPPRA
jgi:hypothetical protein